MSKNKNNVLSFIDNFYSKERPIGIIVKYIIK